MQEEQAELEEGLDAVSDDLSEVESYLYEEENEEDEDDEYDGEEDEDDAEPVYETTCPNCGEEVFFDEDTLDEGCVRCPNCGENLEFDLTDLSDEDEDGEDEEE